jgi:hypothetical protein
MQYKIPNYNQTLTGAPVSVPALALVSQDVQLRSGACPGSNKRPFCFPWKPLADTEAAWVGEIRSAQDTDTVDVYMVGLGDSSSADI